MGQTVGQDGLRSFSTEIFLPIPKIYSFIFGLHHPVQKTMKSLCDAHKLDELCYTKYIVCKWKSAILCIWEQTWVGISIQSQL